MDQNIVLKCTVHTWTRTWCQSVQYTHGPEHGVKVYSTHMVQKHGVKVYSTHMVQKHGVKVYIQYTHGPEHCVKVYSTHMVQNMVSKCTVHTRTRSQSVQYKHGPEHGVKVYSTHMDQNMVSKCTVHTWSRTWCQSVLYTHGPEHGAKVYSTVHIWPRTWCHRHQGVLWPDWKMLTKEKNWVFTRPLQSYPHVHYKAHAFDNKKSIRSLTRCPCCHKANKRSIKSITRCPYAKKKVSNVHAANKKVSTRSIRGLKGQNKMSMRSIIRCPCGQ